MLTYYAAIMPYAFQSLNYAGINRHKPNVMANFFKMNFIVGGQQQPLQYKLRKEGGPGVITTTQLGISTFGLSNWHTKDMLIIQNMPTSSHFVENWKIIAHEKHLPS